MELHDHTDSNLAATPNVRATSGSRQNWCESVPGTPPTLVVVARVVARAREKDRCRGGSPRRNGLVGLPSGSPGGLPGDVADGTRWPSSGVACVTMILCLLWQARYPVSPRIAQCVAASAACAQQGRSTHRIGGDVPFPTASDGRVSARDASRSSILSRAPSACRQARHPCRSPMRSSGVLWMLAPQSTPALPKSLLCCESHGLPGIRPDEHIPGSVEKREVESIHSAAIVCVCLVHRFRNDRGGRSGTRLEWLWQDA
jgi:hypothetical protein